MQENSRIECEFSGCETRSHEWRAEKVIRSAEKNGERTDTMEKSDIRYQAYVSILEEELKPAMGCTEPIAIAYCAAVAREVLGGLPEKVKVGASGSMIKNVKVVTSKPSITNCPFTFFRTVRIAIYTFSERISKFIHLTLISYLSFTFHHVITLLNLFRWL